MNITEYACPNCGATLTLSTFGYSGTCEYCGSKYHIDPNGVSADDGRNYTQKMQERIEAEKAARAQYLQTQAQQPQQENWEKVAATVLTTAAGRKILRTIRRIVVGVIVIAALVWAASVFLPLLLH